MTLMACLLLVTTGLAADDHTPEQILFEKVRVFDGTSDDPTFFEVPSCPDRSSGFGCRRPVRLHFGDLS